MSKCNFLLLVMDSVRKDRLSCYGNHNQTTSNIDSLVKQGCKFQAAYSTGPWTVPVHGSMFTGKLPSEHGAHRKNKSLRVTAEETIAGTLKEEGYQTSGFTANMWVTPEFGYDKGFEYYTQIHSKLPFGEAGDPRTNEWGKGGESPTTKEILKWCLQGNPPKRFVNGIWAKFYDEYPFATAKQVSQNIVEWIDKRDKDSPYFIFANYMDVHEPYRLRESYLSDKTANEIKSKIKSKLNISLTPEPEHPEIYPELYDASLSYLDDQIGYLLDGLRERGELDDTYVIILGDHGQCLGEQGYWGHGTYLYDELVNVPLIISPPVHEEFTSHIHREKVTLRDIPQYIADKANVSFGVKRPDHTMTTVGESQSQNSREGPIIVESHGPRPDMEEEASKNGYRAIYFGDWKGVRNLDTDGFSVEEIGQSRSHNENQTKIKHQLQSMEEEIVSDLDIKTVGEEVEMKEATKEHLKNLGYI